MESITNETGAIVSRLSFNPWGERQLPDWKTGTPSNIGSMPTTYGFTGHEHLDQMGLIHMGGRVYDPTVGRFLAADLFVTDPYSAQTYNRYSYVRNNPLSRIDPTGYYDESTFDHSPDNMLAFGPSWMSGQRGWAWESGQSTRTALSQDFGADGGWKSGFEFQVAQARGGEAWQTFLADHSVKVKVTGVQTIEDQPAETTFQAATTVLVGVATRSAGTAIGQGLLGLGRTAMAHPIGLSLLAAVMPTKVADSTITGSYDDDSQLHRGRIQAQGAGLEKSVAWAQPYPPTAADGLAMLKALQTQLSRGELQERARAFQKAERFIQNAGQVGGVSAPVRMNFVVPGTKDVRVDIDIFTGQAFVP